MDVSFSCPSHETLLPLERSLLCWYDACVERHIAALPATKASRMHATLVCTRALLVSLLHQRSRAYRQPCVGHNEYGSVMRKRRRIEATVCNDNNDSMFACTALQVLQSMRMRHGMCFPACVALAALHWASGCDSRAHWALAPLCALQVPGAHAALESLQCGSVPPAQQSPRHGSRLPARVVARQLRTRDQLVGRMHACLTAAAGAASCRSTWHAVRYWWHCVRPGLCASGEVHASHTKLVRTMVQLLERLATHTRSDLPRLLQAWLLLQWERCRVQRHQARAAATHDGELPLLLQATCMLQELPGVTTVAREQQHSSRTSQWLRRQRNRWLAQCYETTTRMLGGAEHAPSTAVHQRLLTHARWLRTSAGSRDKAAFSRPATATRACTMLASSNHRNTVRCRRTQQSHEVTTSAHAAKRQRVLPALPVCESIAGCRWHGRQAKKHVM